MKNLFVIVALTGFTLSSYAQDVSEKPKFDRGFDFGFNIGLSKGMSSFDRERNPGLDVFNKLGTSIGGLAKYRLTPKLDLEGNLNILFMETGLHNIATTPMDYEHYYTSTFSNLALELQYTPLNNGLYFLTGPEIQYLFADKDKQATLSDPGLNLAMNLGVGYEMDFDFFTFSPELKYSRGLTDIQPYNFLPAINANRIEVVLNFY